MAAINIQAFAGESPRTDSRLLADGRAVQAQNLLLQSGTIKPIRTPRRVFLPTISPPYKSVYRAENFDGVEKWLAWNDDVDVTRAPLPPAVEPRYYWTGDYEPRYATFSMLPNVFYSLGIPKPKTAPMVVATGGAGVTVTRVYLYTFFSQFGEESGASPVSMLTSGRFDGTWTISNMDAFPANSGTGTASVAMGVTTFTNTGFHWLRPGEQITLGAVKTVVASTPSPTVFTVTGNFMGVTAWSRVASWNTMGMKRRLYRSTGSTGSFQLVADDVGTSYVDTLSDADILGDELISLAWDLPPVDMKGILSLPNGALVGFFDNQVLYSEPFQPHAYPIAYRRATDFEIVGIGSYGTAVVACTAGRPYICDGQEPQVVTAESIDKVWPCLSKRSVVSAGDGVMFATSYGMAYVGLRGSEIFSTSLFSRKEWQDRGPMQMVAALAEGRIFVRFSGMDAGDGIMVFDLENPGIGLTSLGFFPDEVYADPRNGEVYFATVDGVFQYDSDGGAKQNFAWRSKEYHFPVPVNFAAAKVDFEPEQSQMLQSMIPSATIEPYAGQGAINGAPINQYAIGQSNIVSPDQIQVPAVTLSLFSENRLVFSKTLTQNESAFRLPAGFKSDTWSVSLTGSVRVRSVKIAESMTALKAL